MRIAFAEFVLFLNRSVTASIIASGIALTGLTQTTGYYTAVLRSECTSAPVHVPPPGETIVGPDYVIKTVATGIPTDFARARELLTDEQFASLMPLYASLLGHSDVGCVTNHVQWNIIVYDADGKPLTSGCAASGCEPHYFDQNTGAELGFVTAVLRSACTDAPANPPRPGETAVGPDFVIKTIGLADPNDFESARQMVTDAEFESLMPMYANLAQDGGVGCVTNRVQWNVVLYRPDRTPGISGCATSGCDFHNFDPHDYPAGYYAAVLRSECTSSPTTLPSLGETIVGPDYVIKTVATGNPTDFARARELVTDEQFASLMPLYASLIGHSDVGCVTNRVQWNIIAYDAIGRPLTSGCATSGCGFHEVPTLTATVTASDMSARLTDGTTTINCLSAVGRTYVLEYTESLAPADWKPIDETPGNGGFVSLHDPSTKGPARFYRIRIK